jgi:hypothetical protein
MLMVYIVSAKYVHRGLSGLKFRYSFRVIIFIALFLALISRTSCLPFATGACSVSSYFFVFVCTQILFSFFKVQGSGDQSHDTSHAESCDES